ncbi:ABC transporter ATP-binding protein [Propioniciclava coleopterorum]|uniref:ABC transporter ATP-binding protein n=1 Tax=Propioniciclava coleopterorum TaxID=2714937 RepID=A0A6G7Y6M7_9ACTN|nr:ABC transporter ATP-binding protein [Propioniciclava coleopterorum]QIK72336.1 ABC transporter ATP-binding protein [Propioniciclava coleopterorum]
MSASTAGAQRIGELLADPPRSPLRRLNAILASDRRAMLVAFVGTIVASLASLAQPALTGAMVAALQQMDLQLLARIGGVLVGVAVLGSLLSAGVNLVVAYAGNRLVRHFRDESAAIALKVPAEKLVEHPTADLVARCSIDSEKMGDVFTRGPIQALGSLVLVGGSLVQMLLIDPVLTGSAVGLCVLALVVIVIASQRLTGISFERQEAQGAYVAEVTRALDAVLTIRAFVANRFAIGRLASTSQRLQDASNRTARAQAFMEPLVSGLIQATMLAIVLIAFVRVQSGALPVDALVAFFLYTMMLVGPIAGATETVMLMAETLGALKRLVELRLVTERTPRVTLELRERLEHETLEEYGNRPRADPDVLEGEISFRNVSVTYAGAGEGAGGREHALSDVSFDVPRGSWVALTGTSGSGKSTILSLMERFLVPSRGLILVDGIPLEDRDEDVYRSQVGYIEQACPLFAGTVRDNLLLGLDGIDDAECWEMLGRVGLGGVIGERPEGLDAPVGESAYAFSGGERQRLAIARTLLRRPRLLLLDEITSGLDVLNRTQIMGLIHSTMGGITTLAAGHGRFATQGADRVLVLDRGRLVEDGEPDAVAARSALFRSLIAQ